MQKQHKYQLQITIQISIKKQIHLTINPHPKITIFRQLNSSNLPHISQKYQTNTIIQTMVQQTPNLNVPIRQILNLTILKLRSTNKLHSITQSHVITLPTSLQNNPLIRYTIHHQQTQCIVPLVQIKLLMELFLHQ